MSQLNGTVITWLGHATVLVTTAKGTTILIDPFIEHNPKYPKDYKLPETLDLLLLSHGHSDHIADALPIAKKYNPQIIGMVELVTWLGKKGAANVTGMNLGGSFQFQDVTISLVEAKHSTGIEDDGQLIYGGVAVGFILTIEGGPVLYHAGDTSLYSDMQLIRDLYQPQVGMLPIGDHYTMGPKAAARAAQYLGITTVIPIHFGTFPALTGTPEQLESHLANSGISMRKLEPGESLS